MNLRKVNIVNVKASDGTFELWLCVCTYNNNTIRMCIHFEAMLMSKVHKQINNKTTELACFFSIFVQKYSFIIQSICRNNNKIDEKWYTEPDRSIYTMICMN